MPPNARGGGGLEIFVDAEFGALALSNALLRAQVSVKVLKGFCERQLSPAEHPCKIIAF